MINPLLLYSRDPVMMFNRLRIDNCWSVTVVAGPSVKVYAHSNFSVQTLYNYLTMIWQDCPGLED